MKCPYCGADLPENARICEYCDRTVTVQTAVEKPEPAVEMKRCQYCGATVPVKSKFCKRCGNVLIPQNVPSSNPNNCANCGAPLIAGVKFCNKCGKPVSAVSSYTAAYASSSRSAAQESKPKKKKGGGRRIIAAILVIAILVTGFWQPGYITNIFRKESTEGLLPSSGKAEGSSSFFDAPVASGKKYTAKLSPENTSAKAGDVSVSMGDYIISGKEKLTVTECKPISSDDGMYEIVAYDVSVGDRHELGDYVEIRIPYDPQEVEDGTELGAAHYNDDTGEWEPVLYEIDEETHEVVIYTDHFSKKALVKYKGNNKKYKVSDLKDTTDFTFQGKRFMMSTDKLLDRLQTNYALATLREFTETGGNPAPAKEGTVIEATNATMSAASQVMQTVLSKVYLKDNAYLDIGGKLFTMAILGDESCSWTVLVKANDVCTKLGLFASAAKMAYIVLDPNKSKQDTLSLYTECANYAISSSTFAPLGLAMSGAVIINYSIGKLYELGMEINYNTINNVYRYYNELYDGPQSIKRSPTEWREKFIEIMDSGNTDNGKAIIEEIDSFCNAFWDIDPSSDLAREVQDDCVSYYGKGSKAADYTWPKPAAGQKQQMINEYKAALAEQLKPVLLSVEKYQQLRMEELFLKQVDATMSFLNEDIEFVVKEESILDDAAIQSGKEPEALYENCTILFAPLSEYAVQDQWTFKMGKGFDGVTFKKKLIDWIIDGQPTQVDVYGENVNPKDGGAAVIKSAPFTLERPKTEIKITQSNVTLDMILGEYEVKGATFTSADAGALLLATDLSEKEIEEHVSGIRIEMYKYKTKKITISSDDPSSGRFTMRVDFTIDDEKQHFYSDGVFENNALIFQNSHGKGAITVIAQNGTYDEQTHMQSQTIILSGTGYLPIYMSKSNKGIFLDMTYEVKEATLDTSFFVP